MRSSSRIRARHTAIAAFVLGGAWLVASCADRIAGPPAPAPFAISEAQRAAVAAALRFAARDAALAALSDRPRADRIHAALVRLEERVATNDRLGALKELVAARATLADYRANAPTDLAGLLEIESMALALSHVELLAAAAPDVSAYADETASR
jgi:hypothetical protein